MNILFLSAEVAPFVTVGGLSQVMYFLSRALRDAGHDVRIFTPRCGTMNAYMNDKVFQAQKYKTDPILVPVAHSWHPKQTQEEMESIKCSVSYFSATKRNAAMYFLENKEYYGMRANVFGYADDHVRFALFSKAALEWLLHLYNEGNSGKPKKGSVKKEWFPDIIHCHDWHTSYFIELARKDSHYKDMLRKIPIVLTVHNFKYQGNGDFKYTSNKEKDDGKKPLVALDSPKLRGQNPLKRGLQYADAITTVSAAHAVEILTPEYSEGLDETLRSVKGRLSGILNGLDTTEFNPHTDSLIKKTFTQKSFVSARKINKEDLQREFSLPINENIPIIAYSGRLASQKGLDIILDAIPHLFKEQKNIQFIALGTGDEDYRNRLTKLRRQYPDRIGLHLFPDFRLPRKIFAGADILLIPSIFEPGGIVALEALRYGAIPIVRRTGGLGDIIQDFDLKTGKGNGFSFEQKDPWSLYGSITEALTIYQHRKLWHKLVSNALSCDFSWEYVAKEYIKWYDRAEKKRQLATR